MTLSIFVFLCIDCVSAFLIDYHRFHFSKTNFVMGLFDLLRLLVFFLKFLFFRRSKNKSKQQIFILNPHTSTQPKKLRFGMDGRSPEKHTHQTPKKITSVLSLFDRILKGGGDSPNLP